MKAKKSKKHGLGKGLSALIPIAETKTEGPVEEIKVDDIRPNTFQPRRDFDDQKLAELAESVRTHGILQPVVVREIVGGYELVAGERRWRAAQLAGLATIPALIRELNEAEMVEVALIENIQREDLNPLEEAEALKVLLTEFGLTQEELAQRVGKSRSHIANIIRLLNLTPEVQKHVSRGTITMGHARALLAIEEPQAQIAACAQIVKRGLSVRQTEEMLRQTLKKQKTKKRAPKDPWLQEVEAIIRQALATKVHIRPGKKGGKIIIEYYSPAELERLINLLN